MKEKTRLISDHYQQHFGNDFLTVVSPGRINLIGEHTDYNLGFVLPAAIDKGIYVGIGRSNDRRTTIYSLDMNDSIEVEDLSTLERSDKGWVNYVLGVVDQLQKAGFDIEPFNCVFGGDIPIGSGLSSSAALENGIGFGLNELLGLGISRDKLIRYSQSAEHEFVGVKCGIMDQFSSMMGKDGFALKLDCRSLDYESYPVDFGDYEIVLLNSNVSHNLASSAYNERRTQCEQGWNIVAQKYNKVSSLRDVSMEMLKACRDDLSEVVFKRCKYIIEENQRVHSFCKSLEKKDFKQCGAILFDAHEAMRLEYEITCIEIDHLVDFAKADSDVLGARMMGGGFGGCTLNLVKKEGADHFIEETVSRYKEVTGIQPSPYRVAIADGVRLV